MKQFEKTHEGEKTKAILGGKSIACVNPKWAWHYRTLLQARNRLLMDRSKELAEVQERLEPHSMNLADSATDEFDHDLALCELASTHNALYEIEEALKRIATGNYGVCETSGKPIPASRLRAIPWTRFSKDVELQLEKKRILKAPQLGELQSVRTIRKRGS